MDRAIIEQYLADATLPARAIEGINNADLHAYPVPDTWSIQEIVLHLMDSDLIASERMKRVIVENHPTLVPYDESAFIKELFCNHLDAHTACEIFRLNRIMTASILNRLPDVAFQRSAYHPEKGRLTLAELVEGYVDHARYHATFIRNKRAMLGKPVRGAVV